jgi:hypothetical protein
MVYDSETENIYSNDFNNNEEEETEEEQEQEQEQEETSLEDHYNHLNWNHSQISNKKYPINYDKNPIIINKIPDMKKRVEYVQEMAIRYLRPISQPPPGDIIIKEERSCYPMLPAPALVLRQQPSRAKTPEPLIIREAPPSPPKSIELKIINLNLNSHQEQTPPPPPRKVVFEKLPSLPIKPQPIIIERWLCNPQVKRRVIHIKPKQKDPFYAKPKNVIVQWMPPPLEIKQSVKFLGICNANPDE